MFQSALAIIYVSDMEYALSLYRDALGASVGFTWPESAQTPEYAVLTLGDTRFGIGTYAAMHDLVGGTVLGSDHATFELALRTDDADRAVAHLRAHGAVLLSPPQDRPWGERAAWLRAPEGHLIRVYGPLKSPPAPPGRRRRSPQALRRPERPA